MKNRLRTTAAALLLVLAAGCGGSGGERGEAPVPNDGWMLREWNGGTALAGSVYLRLGDDGTFDLYQCFDVPGYVRYSGTYRIEIDPSQGELLSGVYSDGQPWADSYRIEERSDQVLRLRALSEGIVSVYVGVVVPGSVKDGVAGGDSRAADSGHRFL